MAFVLVLFGATSVRLIRVVAPALDASGKRRDAGRFVAAETCKAAAAAALVADDQVGTVGRWESPTQLAKTTSARWCGMGSGGVL